MGAGSQLSGFYFHAFDDVCIAPCGRLNGLARGAVLSLLKGNLQQAEFDWDVFRPWLNWPRWQAVELPEDEDELLKLDSLR